MALVTENRLTSLYSKLCIQKRDQNSNTSVELSFICDNEFFFVVVEYFT